jgi:hypothetical protein
LQHLGEPLLNLRKGRVFGDDHEVGLALLVALTDASEEEASDFDLISDDSNEETRLTLKALPFFDISRYLLLLSY